MKRTSRQTFDAFCQEAIDFLTGAATPYLVMTPRRRLDEVLQKASIKPESKKR